MSQERITIGNIIYSPVGDTTCPLLLRSNGNVKVQWGGSFIDLIKDGQIAPNNQINSAIQDLQKKIAELNTQIEELKKK